jgi:hypothetical protein
VERSGRGTFTAVTLTVINAKQDKVHDYVSTVHPWLMSLCARMISCGPWGDLITGRHTATGRHDKVDGVLYAGPKSLTVLEEEKDWLRMMKKKRPASQDDEQLAYQSSDRDNLSIKLPFNVVDSDRAIGRRGVHRRRRQN